MRVLVTGAAGFVGFHVAAALLRRGDEVVAVDSLNDYYDPRLKLARIEMLSGKPGFVFQRIDLAERQAVEALFTEGRFDTVVHLAAQAGVRYSLDHPEAYPVNNLTAFGHVLEGCRHHAIRHLVYASSSSVYGANSKVPFSVSDTVDHPVSLYAATKKANEGMAHAYAHLYGLPTTGLRFFTVYGPWGRPDMAPFIFTRKILAGEPIDVFNNGNHGRDFTYVDDIVDGVLRVLDRPAKPNPDWNSAAPDPATASAPWRLYNIGAGNPTELLDFIAEIERATGKTAIKVMKPKQPGDVERTFADISALTRDTGFVPQTSLTKGIERLVRWYRDYYHV
jgi:UDP-glucuronate 4-epimerase